jgi:hypothetical protein
MRSFECFSKVSSTSSVDKRVGENEGKGKALGAGALLNVGPAYTFLLISITLLDLRRFLT